MGRDISIPGPLNDAVDVLSQYLGDVGVGWYEMGSDSIQARQNDYGYLDSPETDKVLPSLVLDGVALS